MILAGKESVDIWLVKSFLALVDEELTAIGVRARIGQR